MKNNTTQTLGKVIALSLITSAMLHATNGDNLIAVGAKARGMGGTGIAVSHGAESGLANGAMITSVEGTEIDFGGTLFLPDIETAINIPAAGQSGEAFTSDADTNIIPEVSIAQKIDENWYIGIGIWGTAGLGVDYSNAKSLSPSSANNFKMVTNLQLLQFAVPIAYKTEGLSLAVTPVIQYGNLDINYQFPAGFGGDSIGAGLAQDFGFGYNLGVAYDFETQGIAGLTLGATYKSSIELDYKHQLTTAITQFLGRDPMTGAVVEPLSSLLPNGDTLEQPSEYGVGFAYVTGQHTFAFDYKNIKWSDAKGYADFGWEDQNVYAFGYQFNQDNWALRAGYNHADSTVVEATDPRLNFFNLLGFPATAENHYTIGGSYGFTKQLSVDLAYVYAPTSTKTFATGFQTPFGFAPGTITTDHSEDSLSFQLVYNF
jgi:long-chain fatty acid transport protein